MEELKCFPQKMPEGIYIFFFFFMSGGICAKQFCKSDTDLQVSVTPSLQLPVKNPNWHMALFTHPL